MTKSPAACYPPVGLHQFNTWQPWCTSVFNSLSIYFSTFRVCSSTGHGRKTGTNLHSALYRVSEVINFFKQNSADNHFNETQNIIIIETDGKDTGPHAENASVEHLQLMKIFEMGILDEPFL